MEELFYIGLFTEDGEVSEKGYERQPLRRMIVFPSARSTWKKPVIEWALFDTKTGGECKSTKKKMSHPLYLLVGDQVELGGLELA